MGHTVHAALPKPAVCGGSGMALSRLVLELVYRVGLA